MDLMRKKNERRFFKKYPDLKYEQIEDVTQFVPYRENDSLMKYENARNPDTSFCAFILAFLMCLVSILVFYGDRDFTNEYFTRQIIFKRFEQNPFGFAPYKDIATPDELYQFITKSVAYQIFNDGEGEHSKYMFSKELVPFGMMRMRQ